MAHCRLFTISMLAFPPIKPSQNNPSISRYLKIPPHLDVLSFRLSEYGGGNHEERETNIIIDHNHNHTVSLIFIAYYLINTISFQAGTLTSPWQRDLTTASGSTIPLFPDLILV